MRPLIPFSKLSALFAEVGDVHLAYLFGSQAEGNVGPFSDYDVAILTDPAVDAPCLQAEVRHRLSQALETERVDVVLLNRAPIELAYAVIARGRLLFERDRATRVEFEADVLSRYGDYLPVLRAQRADILQGGNYVHRVQRYRAALRRTERTLGEIGAISRTASGRL